MKNIILIILIVIGVVLGSTSILNLSIVAETNLVKIQWTTNTETNVKQFIIEKSSDNVNFESFTVETPKGSASSYAIIDSNPYSKNATLYYRVVVEDYDGTKNISETISVTISTAGIPATWGSIKAMFR
ncbi:MAG: hypothetical protein JXR69_10085 [Candidatus Delongbacteria bacterium]|nr:hypothetical protein [Candidatus Delongbacteria bacterium]